MMLELRLALVFISLVAFIKCSMDPFVVGGKKAKITDFPHSVSIFVKCIKKENDPSHVQGWSCGASIVNEWIVLTAAHCLEGCAHMDVSAHVGNAKRHKGCAFSVILHIVHPAFNSLSVESDIAVAKLNKPLKFDETVNRIAFMKNPPYYEKAQIAGWGKLTDELERASEDLMYTDQWVVNQEYCKQLLTQLPRKTLCAQHKKSKGGYASRGDSGSALVVRGYIQIGLVSYHMPGLSKRLEVFTDTGKFYKWIKRTTKTLYCTKVEGQNDEDETTD